MSIARKDKSLNYNELKIMVCLFRLYSRINLINKEVKSYMNKT